MAIAKTAEAVVKGIALLLSSIGGAVVIFVIIAAVLALMTTAFGVFYSPFDDTEETKGLLRLLRKQTQSLTTRFLKLKIT
ncbi:MAG TPA: hypothetical protein IAB62_02130 [Candidatus Coprocola pullicola]|nr:hypothetical protein [Candidatus Coprocola pullicola]